MEARRSPGISYILSLIECLIVLLYDLMSRVMFALYGLYWILIGGWISGTMDGYHDFMSMHVDSTELFAILSVISLVYSILIIVGAPC